MAFIEATGGVGVKFKSTTEVDGDDELNIGHVRVDYSVLPVGASTSAKQDTMIAALGAAADAEADGNGSIIAILKKIRSLLDGTLTISGTATVTGPLTDDELRATAVPVSGPLTDTQLRATAVPISSSTLATTAKQDNIISGVGATTDGAASGDGSIIGQLKQVKALLGASAAAADGVSNPTSGFLKTALMGWNGSNWDRLTTTTTNGLDVDITRLPIAQLGEVQDSPTAYTVLARLKDITTAIGAISIDPPEGGATEAKQDTLIGHVDGLEGLLTTIDSVLDTMSGLLSTIDTDTGNIATSTSGALTALQIIDDWDESDRAKVNLIAGQAGITGGSGSAAANTVRIISATDDPAVAALGGTSDSAASAGGTGSISAKLRLITSQLLMMPKVLDGDYETIAASQTDQMMGPTGAAGDYLAGVLIIPANLNPGQVSIEDGSTNIVIFTGGTGSVTNLVPFYVPLGYTSVSGGWEITTGASVSAIANGSFS